MEIEFTYHGEGEIRDGLMTRTWVLTTLPGKGKPRVNVEPEKWWIKRFVRGGEKPWNAFITGTQGPEITTHPRTAGSRAMHGTEAGNRPQSGESWPRYSLLD